MKRLFITAGALALSTGLVFAQANGGMSMGNGTTAQGTHSMSKRYNSAKHLHAMEKRHHFARQTGAPTCTQEGTRASGSAYHC